MTIRFAAAQSGRASPLRAWLCRSVALCPANDNTRTLADETTLVAALRHFARHGLGAAEHARARALAACEEGQREGSRHWLAICRQLDRRMAEDLSQRIATSL